MKVILSRKGFDSSNGGIPSPILPDGTLLSLPIPDDGSDVETRYDDLSWDGYDYSSMIDSLGNEKTKIKKNGRCHLDPDLRQEIRKTEIREWGPAFGQTGSANSILKNCGIEEGDLFLFFGWFRHTYLHNNEIKYVKKKMTNEFYGYADLQVIYGYLQVGKILTDPQEISRYWWHPHASCSHLRQHNNTLYLPSEHLSFDKNMPGSGTLTFREDRVLTMPNHTRAIWKEFDFLKPEWIIGQKRKNSAKEEGIYYSGIWQELVFENNEVSKWTEKIIK